MFGISLALLLRYWRGAWRPTVVDEARVRQMVESAMDAHARAQARFRGAGVRRG